MEAAAAAAGSTPAQLFARCVIAEPSFRERWRHFGSTGSAPAALAHSGITLTVGLHEWTSIVPCVDGDASLGGGGRV
ncbi:hypothetical protein OEZ86_008016 [Tetradesmus obliquus]|nr:hypothetical protein OEZ86_008016 [Tetradesmus obliquus]